MNALWAILVNAAFAGWSVEGPSYTSRADATEYARSAKEAGYKGRVVRRFKDGAGWEFVVRVEDLGDGDEAAEVAGGLATATRSTVVVLDEEGASVKTVEPGEAPQPDAKSEGKPEGKGTDAKAGPERAMAPWYEAAAEAHGAGLTALSEPERVKFVYTRKLPDGRIARHTYARRGTDLYLSIEPVEGEVVASTTLALGDAAWLTTKGETTSQDLQRSRETIERFSPTGMLPVVLDLEGSVETHPMLATLKKGAEAKVGSDPVVLYAPADSPTPEVAVGTKDSLIRRITLDGGKRVHEYSKYESVDGVQIPRRILTRVDGAEQPDQIVVEAVELDGDLPDAWFVAPK
ncbi:MAG: hypothetical protein R3F61_33280 [Myxococcota bacterium]